MSNSNYVSELEFAVETAWQAGRITLRYFQTGTEVLAKADASPITAADREAEQLVRERLARYYPQDSLLGEEFGEVNTGARRRWIVDPIDGTRSFVRGVPLYGVMLALEEEGEAVLGVLHFPALSETVWAAQGAGCWVDGRRARVSDTADLSEALVCATDSALFDMTERGEAWQRLGANVGMTRTWGDCYGYALVATGRAEAMVDPTMSVWDSAALKPVIEEAGGLFTDWQGESTHLGGSAVATNAALATEIRSLLEDPR